MALMGTGVAKGENRALEAAQRAISSPLLEETSVQGARGVLLNISGGRDLTLHEVDEAARVIAEAVDGDATIITGWVIDASLEDEMKVTVIATGFDGGGEARSALVQPVRDLHEAAEPRQPMAAGPVDPPLRERPMGRSIRIEDDTVTAIEPEAKEDQEEIPFYRKFIAKSKPDDPGGYGPNWSNVDDFDIPTVLRKQMD
jgi:cell division protein FtsZ